MQGLGVLELEGFRVAFERFLGFLGIQVHMNIPVNF